MDRRAHDRHHGERLTPALVLPRSCFGFFNLLSIVLCIPLLHHSATIASLSIADDVLASPATAATAALVVGVLLPGIALYFPMNAWCGEGCPRHECVHRIPPTRLPRYDTRQPLAG